MCQLLFISLDRESKKNAYSGTFSNINHEFKVKTFRNKNFFSIFH